MTVLDDIVARTRERLRNEPIEVEDTRRAAMDRAAQRSPFAFRQALRYLQRGGMVLTGIDRPSENPGVRPRFFGRATTLPIHHVFLACKAHVPVIVTVTYHQQDGKYGVFASEPIEMDSCLNSDEVVLRNAEKVLAVAEEFIRRAPQQWSVPLPVWPQVMKLVPE